MAIGKKYRWAILGAGHIAGKFAEGLAACPQAIRYAVASRQMEKAEAFRRQFGFERAYGSYEEMWADPDVDIVYVATPNHLHLEHTRRSLMAGKAVLCEKPFALHVADVREMVSLARAKKLFLMEALWSRFLPTIRRFKEEMMGGKYGKPLLLQAEFGFVAKYDENSRLFAPSLGGGAVYDIGIYPLFLALFLFGKPNSIEVVSVPAQTGTDMTTAILMKHANREISMLTASFAMRLECDAKLYLSGGSLRLCRMFHMPTQLTSSLGEALPAEIEVETLSNGYNYEALEVMNCLDRGATESDRWSHEMSIDLMELIDIVNQKAKEQFDR